MNIGSTISKAIKEGKWLNIHYKNTDEQTTIFWIAIYDISLEEQKLSVKMFNDSKSLETLEATISFKKIETAEIIELSNYEVPDEECDLNIVPNKGINTEIKYGMSNSLGFGGQNGTIIFKKFEK